MLYQLEIKMMIIIITVITITKIINIMLCAKVFNLPLKHLFSSREKMKEL